ncbi:hypothetical protein TB2_044053 [Malus domestica]
MTSAKSTGTNANAFQAVPTIGTSDVLGNPSLSNHRDAICDIFRNINFQPKRCHSTTKLADLALLYALQRITRHTYWHLNICLGLIVILS